MDCHYAVRGKSEYQGTRHTRPPVILEGQKFNPKKNLAIFYTQKQYIMAIRQELSGQQ
jgi:hypothetical protein